MLKKYKAATSISDSILLDAMDAQDIPRMLNAEWARKAIASEGWLSPLFPDLGIYDGEISEDFVRDCLPMAFMTTDEAVIHAKLRALSNEVYLRLKQAESAEYRKRISEGLVLQEMQKIPSLQDKISDLSLFVTLIADMVVKAPLDTCITANIGVNTPDILCLCDHVREFPHYFVRGNKVQWAETEEIGVVTDYASENSVYVVFEPGSTAVQINEDELEYVADEDPAKALLGYYVTEFARLNERRKALEKAFDEAVGNIDVFVSSSEIYAADAEFIRGCEERDGNLYDKRGKQLNNCRRSQKDRWYTYEIADSCEDDWHGNIYVPTEEPGTFVRLPFETW